MPKRSREESPVSTRESLTPEFDTSPYTTDELPHSTKYLQISQDEAPTQKVMKCSLPPHAETITFSSFEDFESHYAKQHSHRCQDCHHNFPSDHFLWLHIEENHDPLAEARRARGEKTYRCFVEDCEKVCADTKKRRMHLVDKHLFPKNYDFLIVNTGIDKKSSMLRSKPRKASSNFHPNARPDASASSGIEQQIQSTDISMQNSAAANSGSESPKEGNSTNSDMDSLTSGMSALKFVPPSIRFGRGGRPKGFNRS